MVGGVTLSVTELKVLIKINQRHQNQVFSPLTTLTPMVGLILEILAYTIFQHC